MTHTTEGRPRRIGIVGGGIRGRLFHDALDDQPDVCVVGVCDASPATREALRESGRPPRLVTATHAELFDQGLDIVVIATPDFAHTEAVLDACAAGLDVVVEKPLATSVEEADAIHAAARHAGVRCVVAFENRWNPVFQRAHDELAGPEALLSQSVTLSNTYDVPLQMLQSWSHRSSPGWFLMPHTVDLACWIGGSAPVSVSARGRHGALAARGVDTWDVLMAHLEFADGSIAALQSSWVLPRESASLVDFRYEGVSADARVEFDLERQDLRVTRAPGPQQVTVSSLGGGPADIPTRMIREIVGGLVSGQVVGPDCAHGALVTRVVSAIHEAAASEGVSVPVQEVAR